MKSLIIDVNRIIRNIFRRQHPILAEVIINWGEIVGVKFSKISYPMKISTMREKGSKINVLYVKVDNASLSMEMSFQKDIILERLAVYLGYRGVHKIRLLVR